MARLTLRPAVLWLALAGLICAGAARAQPDPAPAATPTPVGAAALARAQAILAEARAEAAHDCAHPADQLARILCEHRIRVGLRTFYPGFSVRNDAGVFKGFEVDIAARIAGFLGVALVGVPVDARTRIAQVANHEVDLVIATMGHNVQRDSQVRFIRPHYYQSRTVVVGPRRSPVEHWDDMVGRTACVPMGASSNIMIVQHHVRLMTFDTPQNLLNALDYNMCTFIVHDDTFFGTLLTDPAWSARYAVKFGFAPLPWGMAVSRDGADRLAALLVQLSIAYHADGVFLDLARRNRLDTGFLQAEQRRWSSPACVAPDGGPAVACLTPPADTATAADEVGVGPDLGRWLAHAAASWFGVTLDITLLHSESTFELLLGGIGFSFALVAGALVSTTLFSLAFGRLLAVRLRPVRWLAGAVTAIGQTTPMPLLLFFGYVLAAGTVHYSAIVALVVSVLVLGFYNGCYAGRAIHEALRAVQRSATGPRPAAPPAAPAQPGLPPPGFRQAVSVAAIQLIAFLINAAKGSPVAGMIGVPEFLNVISDLTSYARDRMVVYLVLLVFYTGLILVVIALLSAVQARLQAEVRRGA